MRLLHVGRAVGAVFDEANLVSCAGLVPVLGLAERVGLAGLVEARVSPDMSTGSNPGGKAAAVVAGMCAGADSIDDLDVLRHGGMGRLLAGVYAPSTLGSFLRFFTWGHAQQLEAAGRDLLTALAAATPLLPGAATQTYVDVDSLLRRVYGHGKQGASFGTQRSAGTTSGCVVRVIDSLQQGRRRERECRGWSGRGWALPDMYSTLASGWAATTALARSLASIADMITSVSSMSMC